MRRTLPSHAPSRTADVTPVRAKVERTCDEEMGKAESTVLDIRSLG